MHIVFAWYTLCYDKAVHGKYCRLINGSAARQSQVLQS